MNDTSSPTPPSPDSANDVEQRYLLDLDGADIQFNNVKCPTCKTVTPTQWVMIHVADGFGIEEPIALADKHKRLTLCQNCGTVRLVK